MKRKLLALSALFSVFLLIPSCSGETEGDGDKKESGKDSTEVEEQSAYDIAPNYVPDNELPAECEFIDAYVDCHQWTDVNGKNYFVRSLGFPIPTEVRAQLGDPTETQYIYAFHYRETSDGISLIHEYKDSVMACEFDIIMDHVEKCFFVTDLDEDDMGEVTYMYRLSCTSDVSPSTQKLHIVEGHDRYTVNGNSIVFDEGGEYELGEEFANAPEGFEEHAIGIWEEHSDEMGGF
ncbi:MAG: hypothetical protein MI810_17285 [Flavobacteriales bacterium]|jgi:hypothetical protein|nr:hypothetical protein [Flavobacteriales bacterium]